ncbi:MAG: hypothetical protein FWD58_06230 [Firmicutes bacterium]|nr:hypothetical protein [Bacillota bacterium]
MSRKGEKMVEFGEFENKSGTMDITDPCYNKNVWCRKTLGLDPTSAVLPGTYKCFYHKSRLNNWGERMWSCRVVHKDYLDIVRTNPRRAGSVGVDAGLCGFFDNKPDYDAKAWSELCDELQGKAEPVSFILPYGCFTTSGIGDGSYDYFIWRNKQGLIVAAELRFL